MAIEHAQAQAIAKPWGVLDLRPWSNLHQDDSAIGEIKFERPGVGGSQDLLLFKLLFTSEPISIQVHPDDTYARSLGLPNGKSEAWYVLSAKSNAKVALGLSRRLTPRQLRDAIDDGSISKLVVWQPVSQGDVISVPAGTIHALGAGLIVAEIQQRSDTTFRLFDHRRGRELHIDSAVAVSNMGPATFSGPSSRISDERIILASNPHFVFERIHLEANAARSLMAERETWFLILDGHARVGPFNVSKGEVIFAEADRVDIHAGDDGTVFLAAYTGAPISHLLEGVREPTASRQLNNVQVPTSLHQTDAKPANRRPERI